MIAKTIPHDRILSQLAGEGTGVVYEEEDLKLRRNVALKFRPAELKNDPRTNAVRSFPVKIALPSLENRNHLLHMGMSVDPKECVR